MHAIYMPYCISYNSQQVNSCDIKYMSSPVAVKSIYRVCPFTQDSLYKVLSHGSIFHPFYYNCTHTYIHESVAMAE